MRHILGIPSDAYDNLKDDLYEGKTLRTSQQALADVAMANVEASKRVNREHGTVLIGNEVVELCPMTMPEGSLFFRDWKPEDD